MDKTDSQTNILLERMTAELEKISKKLDSVAYIGVACIEEEVTKKNSYNWKMGIFIGKCLKVTGSNRYMKIIGARKESIDCSGDYEVEYVEVINDTYKCISINKAGRDIFINDGNEWIESDNEEFMTAFEYVSGKLAVVNYS